MSVSLGSGTPDHDQYRWNFSCLLSLGPMCWPQIGEPFHGLVIPPLFTRPLSAFKTSLLHCREVN